MANGITDALNEIRKIFFGTTPEEDKEVQDDYEDQVETGRKKKKAREDAIKDGLGIPSMDGLVKDAIPLILVGVLFFFVIKD